MCYRKLIDRFRQCRLPQNRLTALLRRKEGMALFIVLSAMATLAIFVGEITYTAQVNQKLAYDRLDQIKAHSLAKSGLRLALLRIRAYSELKKTIGDMAKKAGANSAAVNAAVPKFIMEKIWNEPITVPFTGDLSGLPMDARNALDKFRKDSSMEGKLYIAIQAQSAKFNLNSHIAAFAPTPAPSATPTPTPPPGQQPGGQQPAGQQPANTGSTSASPSPAGFDPQEARKLLTQQLTDTFNAKFEEDEKFRDRYRNLRPEDLTDEIVGWSDLTYQSQAATRSNIPFKQAPFYDVSELLYLPSVDDELYNVLAAQFTTGVESAINVNTIKEAVLAALVPQMTAEERKKFFEFRDNTGQSSDTNAQAGGQNKADPGTDPNQDNTFKDADGFFKYLQEKVAAFSGSASRIDEFKKALTQRGIEITTDESNFVVRIEATINQTKRTLEAWVSLVQESGGGTAAGGNNPNQPGGNNPNNPNQPGFNPVNPGQNGQIPDPTQQRSNLKITQMRFL